MSGALSVQPLNKDRLSVSWSPLRDTSQSLSCSPAGHCWIFSHFLTWTVSKREPWWEPGLVVGGEQAGVGVEDQQQEQGLQHLGHEEIFSLHCPASAGLSVALYWTNELFCQNFPPEWKVSRESLSIFWPKDWTRWGYIHLTRANVTWQPSSVSCGKEW